MSRSEVYYKLLIPVYYYYFNFMDDNIKVNIHKFLILLFPFPSQTVCVFHCPKINFRVKMWLEKLKVCRATLNKAPCFHTVEGSDTVALQLSE